MNEIIKNMYTRKSVRKYTDKQIPKKDVLEIIKAGIEAPSGHNAQPVRYTVIRDEAIINDINNKTKELMKESEVSWIKKFGSSDKYHVMHKAKTVIFISVSEDCYSPVEDASAAIENMLLAASSLGIGSVWVGLINHYFKLPEAKEVLKIKDGYKPLYVVCLGYENPERIFAKPKRNEDVIDWIE